MPADSTVTDLQRKKDGYDDEVAWHRFLVDAFTGGGGFRGRIQATASGSLADAAVAYEPFAKSPTYLDRFSSEDDTKFKGRKDIAHYTNYVRPTTELKVSYIVRKMHTRTGVPSRLQEWIERTGYDADFKRRALVASVLGWIPVTVDMPAVPSEARNAKEAGTVEPYVQELFPVNLLDWETDPGGNLLWAKTCIETVERDAWNSQPLKVQTYTVWTRRDYTTWRVVSGNGQSPVPSEQRTGTHAFGRVPLVSWRASTSIGDPVRGESIIGDVATANRRQFNVENEFDEHMRSQVFAKLVLPTTAAAFVSGETSDEYAERNAFNLGSDDALVIDPEQKNVPYYLAPPADVAGTYEKRLEKSVIEIYRVARVEYDRASGTASSAQSKAQNFEQTNLAIVDIAQSLARADLETLRLVGTGLGISPEELAMMTCNAHDSYASEDLNAEIEQAFSAIEQREFGTTFRKEILQRAAHRLLPSLDAATRVAINDEIEEAVNEAEQERAAMTQKRANDAARDSGDGADDEPSNADDVPGDGDTEEAP